MMTTMEVFAMIFNHYISHKISGHHSTISIIIFVYTKHTSDRILQQTLNLKAANFLYILFDRMNSYHLLFKLNLLFIFRK